MEFHGKFYGKWKSDLSGKFYGIYCDLRFVDDFFSAFRRGTSTRNRESR